MAMVIICNHFFPTSIISPRTASTVSNQRHSFPPHGFSNRRKKEINHMLALNCIVQKKPIVVA